MEGWRAVLTVVLRYGMAKKQRIEYSFLASTENGQSGEQGAEGMRDDPDAMDVDSVKAMVNGVKNRGVCLSLCVVLGRMLCADGDPFV